MSPLLRTRSSLMLLAASCMLLGCKGPAPGSAGLLSGRSPAHVEGVQNVDRLTDGQVPAVGSAWNTNRTSVFSTRSAYVQYDLGEPTPIAAAALLGDNNDRYSVLGSLDGHGFETIWDARAVRGPGLQWRHENALGKTARYVRVKVTSGDSGLSLAEIALFRQEPGVLPPRLQQVNATDGALNYRNALVLLATALLIGVAGFTQASSRLVQAALAVLVAWGLWQYVAAFREAFPLGLLEVSLTRGVAAAIAVAVVARETWGPKRFPPAGWFNVGALTVAAVMSIGSFFNMGQPQFFDQKNNEPSVVHNYDMRVYYPVAKYFRELKYDGLYLASVATYAEEHGGLETAEMRSTQVRDLRNHRMRPVNELHAELAQVKSRFSAARWAALKTDMQYFWETMGNRAYLGSMADHGGNATPVWLAIAHVLFTKTVASNSVLIASGLLDPLLLLVFAITVFRTFGARTALVCLVVFGANDFYMFGSNWAGATLRNDWMVYLGLGACAFRVGRFKSGGALLAMSALIRAFPAVALLSLALPVLYWGIDELRKNKRLPTLGQLAKEQKWLLDAALGAAVCVGGWFLVSSLVLGFDSWPLWVRKISSFTNSPHVNHISLLTIVAGSEGTQAAVLRARMPLFVALTALYVTLTAWAAWKRPPHVAALLGIVLLPVFMYPANYYMHFVFLLPLLVTEPLLASTRFEREASGRAWTLLLGMCMALYFTVKEQALELHFYNASVILLATLLALLLVLLPRDETGVVRSPFDEA